MKSECRELLPCKYIENIYHILCTCSCAQNYIHLLTSLSAARWSMLVWFRASFSPSLKHPGTSQTSPAECLHPFHHSTLRFLKEINRPDLQFEAAWVLLPGSMLQTDMHKQCFCHLFPLATYSSEILSKRDFNQHCVSFCRFRCWQTLHREMRIRLEWWWSMPGSWELWRTRSQKFTVDSDTALGHDIDRHHMTWQNHAAEGALPIFVQLLQADSLSVLFERRFLKHHGL